MQIRINKKFIVEFYELVNLAGFELREKLKKHTRVKRARKTETIGGFFLFSGFFCCLQELGGDVML